MLCLQCNTADLLPFLRCIRNEANCSVSSQGRKIIGAQDREVRRVMVGRRSVGLPGLDASIGSEEPGKSGQGHIIWHCEVCSNEELGIESSFAASYCFVSTSTTEISSSSAPVSCMLGFWAHLWGMGFVSRGSIVW